MILLCAHLVFQASFSSSHELKFMLTLKLGQHLQSEREQISFKRITTFCFSFFHDPFYITELLSFILCSIAIYLYSKRLYDQYCCIYTNIYEVFKVTWYLRNRLNWIHVLQENNYIYINSLKSQWISMKVHILHACNIVLNL